MTNKHDKHSLKKTFGKTKQGQEKRERRQKLRTVQKNLKRNPKPKQTRRKNWLPDNIDDWDDFDYAQRERIMPRDEGERRRAVEQAAFSTVDIETDETVIDSTSAEGQGGLVVEVRRGFCLVDLGDRVLSCTIRGSLGAQERMFTNVVAVGDEVIVSEEEEDRGVIEAVLPRRSVLARPDVFRSHLQQVIVANADQLLIVSSWREPVIWLELIDRYLVAAERDNLPAVICVNKIDLLEDEAECQATLEPYQTLGYQILLTSALMSEGIDELGALLRNRTTVLAGLSGVGKSSLLSAVQPDLQLRTAEVSEHSGEGRHTTTQAILLRLDERTSVVDTPGIREFGLSGLYRHELVAFFPEIVDLAPNCRFNNCTHLNEPDCAVQAAIEDGKIAPSRYHSYQQIYETLPEL